MGRAGSEATTAGDSQALITSLQAEFPGWRVWRSTATWWATRRGRDWNEPRTVDADSPDELRARLREALEPDDLPAQGPATPPGTLPWRVRPDLPGPVR